MIYFLVLQGFVLSLICAVAALLLLTGPHLAPVSHG